MRSQMRIGLVRRVRKIPVAVYLFYRFELLSNRSIFRPMAGFEI